MFSCISDDEATVSLLLFSLKLIYLFIYWAENTNQEVLQNVHY